MACAVDDRPRVQEGSSPSRSISPSARSRSRRSSAAARTTTTTTALSTSPASSRSRRSRRSERERGDDTIKARTSRHRAGVPAFTSSDADSDEPARESRGRGRGRSRETAPVAATTKLASPAGVDKAPKSQSGTRRSEGQAETDYSADLESETDMDESSDLFFGDFCFTCGAPLEVAPSSPSSYHTHNPCRGYCSEACEQAGTPNLRARRSPFGLGLGAGLTMSPYDSPAIPAFGRSEDEYSTSPSSTSSADSPSPFNAIGHRELRLTAHDEPTALSLPPSIATAHAGQALAKSPTDSTPTRRKLNFDYAYALSHELEQQQAGDAQQTTEAVVFSMPTMHDHFRRESFGFGTGGVQSVDSMLKFKRRSVVAANAPAPSPFAEERSKSVERPRHSRKSSLSSLLALGPSASAAATTTLSHAHRDSFAVAPISPLGSPSGSSPSLLSSYTKMTSPQVVPTTLPASPTMVKAGSSP